MKRREYLGHLSVMATSVLLPLSFKLDYMKQKDNLGIQLFSLPKLLEDDFRGALELLAKMGYTELELFGPYLFSAEEAKESWSAITPMLGFSGSGYFGHTQDEVLDILQEFDFQVPSMHTDLASLRTKMPELGEAARTLGCTYVTLPAIPPEERGTLDDYRRIAEEFNNIGAAANKEGIKFGYHNHGYGLQEIDGVIPLNLIIENTDSDKVHLEMDIYWTTAGGADPVAYLDAFPGRYHLMHLKDMKKKVRFAGDGGDPAQWIELFPYMTTAGDGVLDIPSIITKAKSSGVRHFFVEQDMVAAPEIALKRSFDYLAKI